MNKVKLGIIGIGNMGSGHCRKVLNSVPNMELVAVADINPARLDWAKAELPETVQRFATAEELIDSGVCEAVLIATPHYFHPTIAIYAFEKGLHVLSEKPAGVYTKQVEEMIAAADKSGKVFGLMFNQRTNHLYRKMKEIVDSGELGPIKRTNWIITDWYRTQSYYDSGSWRATWAGEGGGVLLNQCPHNLDLWQWICGMPNKVQAFCHNGKWHNIEVEDDVTAYVEYPNGATGVFVTTTADAPGTNRLEITGEYGKLVCDEKTLKFWKLKENSREVLENSKEGFARIPYDEIEPETDGLNEQHIGIMKSFASAILEGTPLIADGREGIYGLSISNAMHLSSWLGKPVALPIDGDLFFSELNKRIAQSKEKTTQAVTFDIEDSYSSAEK